MSKLKFYIFFLLVCLNSCEKKENLILAILTTTEASIITPTTAISGGNITSDGGAAIIESGICFDSVPLPTTLKSKVQSGNGTGNFIANLSGLKPGIKYYVRAYAINSVGTSYGNEIFFSTLSGMPIITSTEASMIGLTTAASGGNITSDGGATITERGICFDTISMPTIVKNKVQSGNGNGSFIANISGLKPGIKYYIRAYAINSIGTAYGNEIFFTTQSGMPTITTTEASIITPTTAASGGNITTDGGATITERGICFDTISIPTILKNKVQSGSGSGSFTSNLTGLKPGTKFYVRAYAITIAGVAYANEISFSTLSGMPIFTTIPVSAITSNSAKSGGNITNEGGIPVTERGICFDTVSMPTIAKNKIQSGSGSGSFISNLSGLKPGTNYFVRAYAINLAGVAYANEISFISLPELPKLTTNEATDITARSAISGGNIIYDGGAAITERGICYSWSPNPSISSDKILTGSGVGLYNATITNLYPNYKYYVRAYAKNSIGIQYGNEITFKTPAEIPKVSTDTVYDYGYAQGTILSWGGEGVEMGFCYDTIKAPTINSKKIGETRGEYIKPIFGLYLPDLNERNIYYVRAFIKNSAGISYGKEFVIRRKFYICAGNQSLDAPSYNPLIKGIHPLMSHNDWVSLENQMEFPKDWFGNNQTAELMVCQDVEKELVQKCLYTNGMSVYRYYITLIVTLREIKTGKILEIKKFLSGPPESCPSSIRFGSDKNGKIDYKVIKEWLQTYVVK